jgi:hypothetical protein
MKHFILLIAVIPLFFSCSNQTGETTSGNDSFSSLKKDSIGENTKVKLPSPVEFYLFIRESKAQFNNQALNRFDKSSNYVTSTKKALNFGVYASDLAYCTVYEQQQETNNYFKTLKHFAGELGVNEGYDKSIILRINNNLNNSDSLYQITNDSYWKVCNYLEDNSKSNILGPILIGGWIESLYLGLRSVETFSQDNPIVQRITEQRYLLDNLLDYLTTLKKSKDLELYVTKLSALQASFVKLATNPNNILITKDQYNEISEKVADIRNEITR